MTPLYLTVAHANELLDLRLSQGRDVSILKEAEIRIAAVETANPDVDHAKLPVEFAQVEYDLLVSG